MANEINLEILTQIDQSLKSLNDLQKSAVTSFKNIEKSSEKAADTQVKNAKSIEQNYTKAFSALKIAAGAAIAVFASRAIVDFFRDGIEAANEEQRAINNLNTALQLNGKFTKELSKEYQVFADEIEKTTSLTAEQVLETSALLNNMTRLSDDGIKQATNAAIELSSAFKIDLNQATKLLAKAANGQTDGFRRLGLEISETGTKAEVFQRVVTRLSDFQGSAAKQANTFSAASAKLGDAFSDISKELLKSLVNNEKFTAFLRTAAGLVKSFADDLGANASPLASFASFIADLGVSALPLFVRGLEFAVGGLKIATRSVQLILATIGSLGDALVGVVSGPVDLFLDAFTALRIVLLRAGQAFDSLFGDLSGVAEAEKKIVSLTNSLSAVSGGIRGKISDAIGLQGFNSAVDQSIGKSESFFNTLDSGFSNTIDAADSAKQTYKTFTDQISKGSSVAGKADKAFSELDDTTEDLKTNVKDLSPAYDALTKKIIEIDDEQRKRGATAQDLARFELEDTFKIIKAAEDELAAKKKLNAEAKKQIETAKEVARNRFVEKSQVTDQPQTEAPKRSEERDIISESQVSQIGSLFGKSVASALGGLASIANPIGAAVNAINAVVGVIDQVLDLIPNLINNIANIFTKLTELPLAIAKGLANLFKSVVGLARNLLRNIVQSLGSIVKDALLFILKDLPVAITQALTELPTIITEVIGALPDLIVSLIENLDQIVEPLVIALIEAQPRIALALVDSLIVEGGIFRIAVALAKALAFELPKAIVNGIIGGAKGIGDAIASSFKNALSGFKLSVGDLSESTKNLLRGGDFAKKISDALNSFAERFQKALQKITNPGGGSGGVFGQIGGAVSGGFKSITGGGGGFSLAKGGTVYAADGAFIARGTDTVPGMLSPGETVVTRDATTRLDRFLDRELSPESTQSNDMSNLSRVMTQVLAELRAMSRGGSSDPVSINLSIGEKQLSEVLVNLNRQGFRTA